MNDVVTMKNHPDCGELLRKDVLVPLEAGVTEAARDAA